MVEVEWKKKMDEGPQTPGGTPGQGGSDGFEFGKTMPQWDAAENGLEGTGRWRKMSLSIRAKKRAP